MPAKRTLPADVYDALEMSAEAFGGVGAFTPFSYDYEVPQCIIGHAAFLDGKTSPNNDLDGEVMMALLCAFGFERPVSVGYENDGAIEGKISRDNDWRVPFAVWCAELGVVRGK